MINLFNRPTISMLETEIDNIKTVRGFLMHKKQVIGTCHINWPYTTDAFIGEVFIKEEYRGKGYMRELFNTMCTHLTSICPNNKYIYLFVEPTNPIKSTYERYGFSTYTTHEGTIAMTDDGKFWMRKKVKK